MADFHLYELSGKEFEDLVVQICRDWLGQGVSNFAPGRDGGRDAKFEGTADKFPSKASPATGKFIIQAKSTSTQIASCSDRTFLAVIKKELPKIIKLKQNDELDNYILFTNRKKTGDTDEEIVDLLKKTGVENFWLRGREEIEAYLDTNPVLVKNLNLERLRSPLRIHPEDLALLIRAFHSNQNVIDEAIDSMHNFSQYPGINKKNKINHLTKKYFEYIQSHSEPYFNQIQKFLENPRNAELRKCYHNTADEFQAKIITHRDRFVTFDDVFTQLYDLIIERCLDLEGKHQLVHVFMHYMYCNCDFGNSKQ